MGVTMYKITHTRPVHKRHVLKNYTNKVIKVLTPEIREGMVTVKDCVIFGKKRSGKTWLEKSIAEKIVERYGEDNVSVYMSDSLTALAENINKPTTRCGCGAWNLFEDGSGICKSCKEPFVGTGKDKKVKVLIIDDPLKRYLSRGGTTKEQREAIGDYEAIAHRLEEKLKTQEGVIIIIIGSQQYKGLEKTFRDAPILIFKTTMGDDQWEVNKKLNYNKKAIGKLREVTDDIFIKDIHSKRSENVVKVGEKVGYCTFEPCDTDYTVFIREDKAREKRKQEARFNRILRRAKIIADETTLEGKDRRGIQGHLMMKEPDKMDEINEDLSGIRAVVDVIRRKERELGKAEASGKEVSKGESIYEDIEFKKDENDFVWDYWKERDEFYKMMSREHENVNLLFCAYEWFVLHKPYEGRVLHTQEEVANALVEKGLVKHCTQQRVSQMCNIVKGALENWKGRRYEFYVKNRLKKEVVEGLFDANKIKEVMYFGEVKTGLKEGNYPDLIVRYENGDIDVVSCKCFNDKDYVVYIEDEKRCSVKPELEVFEKLHKGKGVKLPDGSILSKNINVRLVLMLKSTNEGLPYETYKVYEKLEELPQTLSFSKKKIKSGVLNIAKWVKTSTDIYKGEVRGESVDEEKKGRGRPKKEIDSERVLQLRKEGKSVREIANQLNASVGFVHKILKEHKEKE